MDLGFVLDSQVIEGGSCALVVSFLLSCFQGLEYFLFEIVISLVIASVCAKPAFTGCPFPEWMPNLIFAVVLLTSFQLVTNLAECLPYNDIIHVEKYLHMFYQVAKRYFWIVLGFLPLLMMFAFCFQGVFPSII